MPGLYLKEKEERVQGKSVWDANLNSCGIHTGSFQGKKMVGKALSQMEHPTGVEDAQQFPASTASWLVQENFCIKRFEFCGFF